MDAVETARRSRRGSPAPEGPASRVRAPLRLLSDERLVRRVARGDRAAFSEIYSRYHVVLYRYCRSLLRSEEDARDALQNTMIAAMRGLAGESRSIALKPWLFRIAHNEAISIGRRIREHAVLEDVPEPAVGSAEDQLLVQERRRQLVEDLRELPDRQRSALVMRELSGLAHGEIAAAMEITVAAAKQAVYEARSMLHEFEEGRAMDCAEVRRIISDGDGRVLRRRGVRAHLRGCAACSAYRQAIAVRSSDLRAIAPPLAPFAFAALLQSVIGGSVAGGSAAAGTGAAGGTAAALATSAGGKLMGASLATKVGVLAATAAVGTGAVVATEEAVHHSHKRSGAPTRSQPATPATPGVQGTPATPATPSPNASSRTRETPSRTGETPSRARDRNRGRGGAIADDPIDLPGVRNSGPPAVVPVGPRSGRPGAGRSRSNSARSRGETLRSRARARARARAIARQRAAARRRAARTRTPTSTRGRTRSNGATTTDPDLTEPPAPTGAGTRRRTTG
jgi:RNA polymerase sigma factor (sigma-70 family)